MPDEIILARMMTTLDLEFERALHYHDEGYESDNDCGPICVYAVFTKASFDPADFRTAQCLMSPSTPRCPRNLPFWGGIFWHLTIDETLPPMPETDSKDGEEPLPTADLDNLVWDEEPVPDSREYLCIHEILRPAMPTPPSWPIPVTPPLQPNQGVSATPHQQPDHVEVVPEFELMELDIPEDIPGLLDVPQEVISDFSGSLA